jgi:hypothetical protein
LERIWLGESQFTRVGYYGITNYHVFVWVFAWDYWGRVWGVGGTCNLHYNGHNSLKTRVQFHHNLQFKNVFLGKWKKKCDHIY